ncbi:MAG: hypothetical protein EXQ94_11860 [Alphaproteobacteria bacterium]|nr:hypothetical protein [Alphaproteobacteria bacterium]
MALDRQDDHAIRAFARRRTGTRSVSIGGDHAITGKDARLTGGRKCALLHFDAHRDDCEHIPHWLGSVRSAAHWAAYALV